MVPAPGVGQVGAGLENSWGLEEDVDEEEEDKSGEESQKEEQQHDRKHRGGGLLLQYEVKYVLKCLCDEMPFYLQ